MKLFQYLIVSVALIFSGCQSNFYTLEDYSKVLKIDTHVHLNSDKGYFEDQAIKDNFKLITINVDHSDSADLKIQHDNAVMKINKYPGRVYYEASFYFDTAGWGTEAWTSKVIANLERDISGGAIGVKIWKNIGMTVRDRSGKFIMADDPALKPVFDFIVSKNLPLTAHLGEPRNCWLPLDEMTVSGDRGYFTENPQYHMYLHPEYPSYEDQINARDHLLELHPEMNVIGCHLGSIEYDVDELAKRLDKYPNMVVDMAARICHLQYQSAKDKEKVRNFCIGYQDRLLYGTDLSDRISDNREEMGNVLQKTWMEDWKYFATNEEMTSDSFEGKFTGLQLPKEAVNKIFSENAIKWYNLAVK